MTPQADNERRGKGGRYNDDDTNRDARTTVASTPPLPLRRRSSRCARPQQRYRRSARLGPVIHTWDVLGDLLIAPTAGSVAEGHQRGGGIRRGPITVPDPRISDGSQRREAIKK
jgi:hypothetical protein